MTKTTSIIPNAIETELTILRTKYPGYDFAATVKADTVLLTPAQIIKNIVAELETKYTDIKFSLARNTYDAFAIIKFAAKPGTYDLAWYQNTDVGYIADDIIYDINSYTKNSIDFKNAGMRVDYYIDNCRSGEFVIYA